MAQRKRIVLHVGLHKTGSTSIQTLLRSKNKALRSVGVMYPGPDVDDRLDNGASHRAFLCALTGNFQKVSRLSSLAECQSLLDKSVELFRTDDNLDTMVLSHEALGRRFASFDPRFAPAWAKEFDLSLVLYVRPLREWIESWYVQLLWTRSKRAGRAAATPLAKTLDKTIEGSLPSTIYDGFRKALPTAEIDLRSFNIRRDNDDLLKHFVDNTIPRFSSDFAMMKQNRRKNPSRMSCGMMFLFHLLRGGGAVSTIEAVRRALLKGPKEGAKPPFADRAFYFVSDEQFARLAEIDAAQAARFPHLALDAPVTRKAGAAFRLSAEEYREMLEWIRPEIPAAAYQDALERYKV